MGEARTVIGVKKNRFGNHKMTPVQALVATLYPSFTFEIAKAASRADLVEGREARFTPKWLAEALRDQSDNNLQLSPDVLASEELARRKKFVTIVRPALAEQDRLSELSETEVNGLHAGVLEERRFFSQPAAVADYDYWRSRLSWRREEVVALSLGKDPRRVSWEKLASTPHDSPFFIAYSERRETIFRAVELGDLKEGITVSKLKTWAKVMKIRLPEKLIDRTKNPGLPLDVDKLHHRERETFHRVLLYLAKVKFGFDPDNPEQAKIRKQLLDDLEASSFPVTPKTLGPHFDEAVEWARKKNLVAKRRV